MDLGPLQAVSHMVLHPTRDSAGHGFDVRVSADGPVVACVRQPPHPPMRRARPPFEIRVGGPAGTTVALAGGSGPVGAINVAAPDGAILGSIRKHGGRWELSQPQAPLLIGTGRGIAGAVRKADAEAISGLGLSQVLPYRVLFTANGEPALTIQRHTGVRSRYTIDIQSTSLDRRLVLAQVIALNRFA